CSAPSKNVSAMYFARRGSPGRRQASAYAPGSARRWIGIRWSLCDDGLMAVVEPTLGQILSFCAEDPIERVFLEDIARRGLGRFTALAQRGRVTALCHAGANLVPSGQGCAAFAELAEAAQARMIIGEQGAVSDLWTAASPILPSPRADRPDQPVYVLDEAPEPG